MKINGQCHCGDIVYTAEIDETKVVSCHCSDCQEMSSGPFRSAVISLPNSVIFSAGKPKEYVKIAESGNKRAQGFCGNCGTSLYATSVDGSDKVYGLRIGAIKQREQLTPKAQIWCRSSVPWLKKLSDIAAFDKALPVK